MTAPKAGDPTREDYERGAKEVDALPKQGTVSLAMRARLSSLLTAVAERMTMQPIAGSVSHDIRGHLTWKSAEPVVPTPITTPTDHGSGILLLPPAPKTEGAE